MLRRWQHLHFFQFKAFTEARVPRVARAQCGKTSQPEVPWSRPGSGFSVVMEASIALELEHEADPGMHRLQRSGQATARAWRLKEALRSVFREATTREQAEPLLTAWVRWARRSRLPAFKRLGQTVRSHLDGILGHFSSGLSNGFLESMNGLIQAAKTRARGYRTDARLILVAYLVCGKLKHLPANPWRKVEKAG